MAITPYYQDEASGIVIYHGDCRELLPEISSVDLVLTDPPYGVSERTSRASNGRSNATASIDWLPVAGDDEPFDPTIMLMFPRVVLFGGNHFADKLPPSPSWIIWDKRDGTTSDDNADCEMAWTNLGGPARLYRHLWRGMIKASERHDRRLHPTQKPIALMAWIIAGWTKPADTVLDPYMGAGSTLRAAKDLGRKAIGIEIEERYAEIAAKRLQQSVMVFA